MYDMRTTQISSVRLLRRRLKRQCHYLDSCRSVTDTSDQGTLGSATGISCSRTPGMDDFLWKFVLAGRDFNFAFSVICRSF